MIGRASRMHPAKQGAIILDHGSNITRHGYFTDEIDWTLDWSHRATKDYTPKSVGECPRCKSLYRGGRCNNCGYTPNRLELKAQGLKFDGKELVEAVPKVREKSTLTSEQIMVNTLYRAGKSNKNFKQLVAMCREEAARQGIKFEVPAYVTVAGKRVKMIPYGHFDAVKSVKTTYPFTVGNWSEHINPYVLRKP
jgi:hypothetical protein